MRSKSKIKEALLDNQRDLAGRSVLYECAGDYVRGWVTALEWVLDEPASQQANEPDLSRAAPLPGKLS